jgi:multidrug efflux pump subunit AcrA (membrane-fusion protein)
VLRAGGADNAALLPLTALYRRDGKPAVWIYDPATRKVTLRPVDILAYREDGVVIRAGLNTGDYVVTAGVHKLTEGQTVRPYRPNGATDAPPAAAPQPG